MEGLKCIVIIRNKRVIEILRVTGYFHVGNIACDVSVGVGICLSERDVEAGGNVAGPETELDVGVLTGSIGCCCWDAVGGTGCCELYVWVVESEVDP